MRKTLLTGIAVAMMGFGGTSAGYALPSAGAAPSGETSDYSSTDDVRLFCYNRASGRFLHWGRCGGGVPRVYCRNSYSGRFLHWGACY